MKISEDFIASIWEHQWFRGDLVSDQGKRLEVISPGRRNNDSGPDFKGAVVAVDSAVLKGDIEIHVKTSEWYGHGHYQDPDYNGVILHVVLWQDGKSLATTQGGLSLPTLCLNPFLTGSLDELYQRTILLPPPSFPCHELIRRLGLEKLGRELQGFGEERFKFKASQMENSLYGEEAGQVLFRGVMKALGYAKNTQPFEALAQNLPLAFLEKLEPEQNVVLKQAWLLGKAGLLPSQRGQRQLFTQEGWIEELEEVWQASGDAETMKESDWNFFRVRPDNFPTRRLAAQSYLLVRYQKTGLLLGLLQQVKEAIKKGEPRLLEAGLITTTGDYWARHYDFGIVKARNSALLGQEKASEIVINVVLPFAFAWGKVTGDHKLCRDAFNLYSGYLELTGNKITRYMAEQLFPRDNLHLSACQQQGLIYIFKNYCEPGDCSQCPFKIS